MAHIPDGFLTPAVLAGTAIASVAALGLASNRTRSQLGNRQAPLLGAMTAFVFAAQMLNFPIGAGTSAHLLGGVLVATVVGPWAAMLSIFAVVLVQALLFQDGGIAALGANTFNLAVLGAGGGYIVYRWALMLVGASQRARAAAASNAGFASAMLTGIAVALQLAASEVVSVNAALAAIGIAHIFVGIAEGAITGTVLAMLLRARPELFAHRDVATPAARRWSIAGTAVAGCIAVIASAIASESPDVLERGAATLGLVERESPGFALFADYSSPLGGWLAAVAGVAVVFAVSLLIGRVLARRTA